MHPNFRVIATVLQLKDLRFSYFLFFGGGLTLKLMYLISGDTRPSFFFLDVWLLDMTDDLSWLAHFIDKRLTAALVDSKAAWRTSLRWSLFTPAS